jgi:hypothetical protein
MYTVSQEKGRSTDRSKHLEANFNRHSFCRELKKHFLYKQFDQVILDYFGFRRAGMSSTGAALSLKRL